MNDAPRSWVRHALLAVVLLFAILGVPSVHADDTAAPTVVHLLDYVGVDYPSFVKNGEVLRTPEGNLEELTAQAKTLADERLPLLQRLQIAD